MEAVQQRVKEILSEIFSDQEIQIELNQNGRVAGFIVSEKFVGMDHEARQRKIWSLLEKKITRAERSKILGFMAFTPEEHAAYGALDEPDNLDLTSPTDSVEIDDVGGKVKEILLELFGEREILIETEPDGRVSGFIISEKFIDVEHEARQRMIWSVLERKITKVERRKIIGFIPFTPAEYEAYCEPDL